MVTLKSLIKLFLLNFSNLEVNSLNVLEKLENMCSNIYLSPKKIVKVTKKNLDK